MKGVQLSLFESVSKVCSSEVAFRKHFFLQQLAASKGGYKRYLGSPLRYAGGKSQLVGYIIEHLPSSIRSVVSPFMGGGSVEIAIAKELGIPVIGYDVFDILINYWKVQISQPKELAQKLEALSPTKEVYNKVKQILKAHWEGKIVLDEITLAAYYFFNHNLSYGTGFLGWMSSVYAKKAVYERMKKKVRTFCVKNLQVFCADFRDSIPKHKEAFLYCDPPYYLGPDSTLFRGLYPQRNFPIHHHNFDHRALLNLLKEHKGGFILSYNDCPTIRAWYKDWCKIIEIPVHYTMGQGETRIGKNRAAKGRNHVKKQKELLIIRPPNR